MIHDGHLAIIEPAPLFRTAGLLKPCEIIRLDLQQAWSSLHMIC